MYHVPFVIGCLLICVSYMKYFLDLVFQLRVDIYQIYADISQKCYHLFFKWNCELYTYDMKVSPDLNLGIINAWYRNLRNQSINQSINHQSINWRLKGVLLSELFEAKNYVWKQWKISPATWHTKVCPWKSPLDRKRVNRTGIIFCPWGKKVVTYYWVKGLTYILYLAHMVQA